MNLFPCLVRSVSASGEPRYALGEPLVDSYLEFVAGRCRANTVRAVAFDLKVFFGGVEEGPVAVRPVHVFEFLAQQRGDRTVVRMHDRESGLSARTIARRLSSVSGFYAYLVARGDTPVTANPVPRGLQTRRAGGRARRRPIPAHHHTAVLRLGQRPSEARPPTSFVRGFRRDRALWWTLSGAGRSSAGPNGLTATRSP